MFEPKNEAGVVTLFAYVCGNLGYEIIEIGSRFPDAILRNRKGEIVRAEFEFISNNFVIHKHDPAAVDLVICWRVKGSIAVPVLELSTGEYYPAGYRHPRRVRADTKQAKAKKVAIDGIRIEIGKYWSKKEQKWKTYGVARRRGKDREYLGCRRLQ